MTRRRSNTCYRWRAKSARPGLIARKPSHCPRRTSNFSNVSLIVGGPARRNECNLMQASSSVATQKRTTNEKQTQSANSRIKPPFRLPNGSTIDRARNDACRLDFVSFIEAVFNLLAPGRPFLMNWHIWALAYHLEQVRLGRIKRLIINLPPQFLKSLISSIAFPAFVLGHDPTKRLLVISYGLELAAKFSHDSQILMSSGLYKCIFPGTRIARNAASEIVTTRGGHRFGTSLAGC